jgi:hypothetical protein
VGRCRPCNIWPTFRDSRTLCHLRRCLVERQFCGDALTSNVKLVFADTYERIRSAAMASDVTSPNIVVQYHNFMLVSFIFCVHDLHSRHVTS